MTVYDAAIEAPTAHDALLECAAAGLPGPVLAHDEGCDGHVHAMFFSEDEDLREQLEELVYRPRTRFLAVMELTSMD